MSLHAVPRAAEAGGSAAAPPWQTSHRSPVSPVRWSLLALPSSASLSSTCTPEQTPALRGAHVSCSRVARSSLRSFEWMNKEFGRLRTERFSSSKEASSFGLKKFFIVAPLKFPFVVRLVQVR